ncbi:DUF4386 domain-containing protein [Limimaricola sp.]|uniref:DUF4386 domain-containing protein n=1 Tax=Limimaricola sp. TaxID=2211665 RepID=UPI0025B900E9|nr:DUF4386 domain-containing protein [Limimaricola sp.]
MTPPASLPRAPAIAAGLALLFMTVAGPFGLLTTTAVTGAAEADALAQIVEGPRFRLAALAFILIALADIVAAWGLYLVLRPGADGLALLAAWLRVAYAVMLAVATSHLVAAQPLAAAGDAAAVADVARFSADWALSLGIFGAHLVVLGLAGWRSRIVPRLIAALVAIGGLAYFADAYGPLVWPGYALGLAAYLFFGEILLMLWLFWAALRR